MDLHHDDLIEACVGKDPILLAHCVARGVEVNCRDHEYRPAWSVLLCGEETAPMVACFRAMLVGKLRLDRADAKGGTLVEHLAGGDYRGCAQALLQHCGTQRVLRQVEKTRISSWQEWWRAREADLEGSRIDQATPTLQSPRSKGPRL